MAQLMEYTNCLNMEQIDYLDLFDDIPYKYIKNIIKDEDYDLEVEITDLECDRVGWCRTNFKFELQINISQGSLPLYVNKKFEVIKEYNADSHMAMFIGENLTIHSDEEEDEDNCAECCRCGEDVSNDEGEGKQVDGDYWCVDCVDDFAHRCELCKKYVEETEYLPSKEDQEKQQILGNDYCIECYKKVEKFEFVENIDLDK